MEIEVGEYVRTKKGFIAKVSEIESGYVFSDDTIDMAYEECRGYVDRKEIVKHSKNIIDLIKVGDYVNGYPVIDVYEDHICVIDFGRSEDLYENDINSIVTKEQFKTMEFKVGEE